VIVARRLAVAAVTISSGAAEYHYVVAAEGGPHLLLRRL
jgi:hypothetical protein